MGATLILLTVAISIFALRAHFRQALVDPHNLATVPNSLRLWIYSVGCTASAYLSVVASALGEVDHALFLSMAALATVVGPAVGGPIKFTSDEFPSPMERRWENLKMAISGALLLKAVVLVGALLSSLVLGPAWIAVLVLAGIVSTQGRAHLVRARIRGSEAFAQLSADRRVEVHNAMLRESVVASIAYSFWVASAGVLIEQLDGFSPWNIRGYGGLATGLLIAALDDARS